MRADDDASRLAVADERAQPHDTAVGRQEQTLADLRAERQPAKSR
ncbi:hypothetical protein ACFQZ4_52450 [Catellatospora coxensis]|uniref:Uncharacterized protein n=1 Tax=Catellatospora coxensis TaxID=310354 RepID=A0A8J3L3L2_9ACTN|nr:hypothetical protein [Catellatospora coxensis]GIG11467.1 hypothetical protein Cco03nite_81670 [Catellatospora coxensis]